MNQAHVAEYLRRSLARLGAMLLPQDCVLCGAPGGALPLCAGCVNDLPALPAERCPVCALPTPGSQVCGSCIKQPPRFDATFALYRYDFPLDRLVQAFKYGHRLALGAWFARSLAELPLPPADLLIPLPLSALRLRERGFNQAQELARTLSRRQRIPLSVHICQRTRHTVAQTQLPWKMRQKNVRHAFECVADLSAKHIIVVDDVMTTGATLDEFARTLKQHGAARVTNLVVARALKP